MDSALYNPKGWPAIVGFICFIAVASGLWIRESAPRRGALMLMRTTLHRLFPDQTTNQVDATGDSGDNIHGYRIYSPVFQEKRECRL